MHAARRLPLVGALVALLSTHPRPRAIMRLTPRTSLVGLLTAIAATAADLPQRAAAARAQHQLVTQQLPRVRRARPWRDLSSKCGRKRRH